MSTLYREIGLSLYRWATMRTRSSLVKSFANAKTFPASVLFYHRVATHSMNDWSIEKRNFVSHLDWIVQNAAPVSLDEIWESQLSGTRDRPMVAITFDDGYGENYEHAVPALMERNIPCTYFVTTHYVETGEPFPHDVNRSIPLKPNTIAEIQSMAEKGFEIGAHSHTHINFGQELNDAVLRREITDVRKRLQDWTGQAVNYFAFPYGLRKNISQQAIDTVFDAGFKCFVSAMGGLNHPGRNANHLQRFHGDPGMSALKNRLTFDPRKVHANDMIEAAFQIPSRKRASLTTKHESVVTA